MATMAQKRKYKALRPFYDGEPPVEIVMDSLSLNAEDAVKLINEMTKVKETKAPPKEPIKQAPPPIIPPVPPIEPEAGVLTENQIRFIRWPVLVIGIVALALSCYFGVDSLTKRQALFIAIPLGIVLIGFGRSAFQVAVYKKRLGQDDWWIFGLVWVVILFYGMNSTTYSFYDRWTVKQSVVVSQTVADANSKELLTSYAKEENDVAMRVADKRKRLAVFQSTLDKYTADPTLTKGSEYNTAVYGAIALEKEIKSLEDGLKETINKKRQLLEKKADASVTTAVGRKNYYEYVSGILKKWLSADTLQFIVDLIPAIALDVICDMSLYIFLFLGKRPLDAKKKKK